jgi:hypothetical protein
VTLRRAGAFSAWRYRASGLPSPGAAPAPGQTALQPHVARFADLRTSARPPQLSDGALAFKFPPHGYAAEWYPDDLAPRGADDGSQEEAAEHAEKMAISKAHGSADLDDEADGLPAAVAALPPWLQEEFLLADEELPEAGAGEAMGKLALGEGSDAGDGEDEWWDAQADGVQGDGADEGNAAWNDDGAEAVWLSDSSEEKAGGGWDGIVPEDVDRTKLDFLMSIKPDFPAAGFIALLQDRGAPPPTPLRLPSEARGLMLGGCGATAQATTPTRSSHRCLWRSPRRRRGRVWSHSARQDPRLSSARILGTAHGLRQTCGGGAVGGG